MLLIIQQKVMIIALLETHPGNLSYNDVIASVFDACECVTSNLQMPSSTPETTNFILIKLDEEVLKLLKESHNIIHDVFLSNA